MTSTSLDAYFAVPSPFRELTPSNWQQSRTATSYLLVRVAKSREPAVEREVAAALAPKYPGQFSFGFLLPITITLSRELMESFTTSAIRPGYFLFMRGQLRGACPDLERPRDPKTHRLVKFLNRLDDQIEKPDRIVRFVHNLIAFESGECAYRPIASVPPPRHIDERTRQLNEMIDRICAAYERRAR